MCNLTYQEQLQRDEWKSKRLHILNRDGMRCIRCKTGRSPLIQMFHKFEITQFEERGITLISPPNQERTHFNLGVFDPKYGLNEVKYLDDEALDFNQDNLIFGLTYEEVDLGILGRQGKVRYICFYQGLIEKHGTIDLNVHHRRYIVGKCAWEYEDDDLETLCVNCHQKIHEETEINIYKMNGDFVSVAVRCGKCGGSGYIREYDYYKSGVCFDCQGEGVTFGNHL